MAEQQTPAIDSPSWWTTVSQLCGQLVGIALDHPGTGLQNALDGKYHSNNNDGSGLDQWVEDHPPSGPVAKGVEHVEESGTA